jgi:hypothetical protein
MFQIEVLDLNIILYYVAGMSVIVVYSEAFSGDQLYQYGEGVWKPSSHYVM